MNDAVTLAAAGAPSAPALTLRPWTVDDVAELVVAYQDPAMRHWNTSVPKDHDAARAWIENHQKGWSDGRAFAFAVLEVGSGPEPRLVGHVALREVTPGAPGAEVGYWTVADARGRGVAHRALEAITSWAFDTFGPSGLQYLKLLHQVDNAASCRVAAKAGYVLDEVLAPWPPLYPLEGHAHVRVMGEQ
jgi:RimJ/RimL family protein N-acetyltransferase